MKSYPSVPGPKKAPKGAHCLAFYKHDGSNLRMEWNKKRGWYKFGTRRRLFDQADKEYGPAIDLFMNIHGEPLAKMFIDHKNYKGIEQATVFCEYFGPSSFAGWHDFSEPFELRLFDVEIHKKGFVAPRQFVDDFSHLHVARVVYEGPFDDNFIVDVRENRFNLGEGVVAKGILGNERHGLWLAKVKCKSWVEELKRRAAESEAFKQALAENMQEQS